MTHMGIDYEAYGHRFYDTFMGMDSMTHMGIDSMTHIGIDYTTHKGIDSTGIMHLLGV